MPGPESRTSRRTFGPAGLGQPHDDLALALVFGHRLVRVLDEIEEHLLDLPLVGQDRPNVPEVGDDLHAVSPELVGFELDHPLDLILETAGMPLGGVPAGEPQQVLEHLRRARRLLHDRVQPLAALRGTVRAHEQELGLAEDRGQAIARLVRETGRQLADGRELLALDQLRLGRLEIVELAPCRRVELRVLQGQADLVGAGLDERDLGFGERLGVRRPSESAPRIRPRLLDRHAHEGVDPFLRDGRARRRQQIDGLADVRPVQRLAGGGRRRR
jgi:hypothetical protein